jgi:hypothetical protein
MSRFSKLAALAAAIAALTVALAGSPAAQAGIDTSQMYRITTLNSLALDVEGASMADDARVIQWGVKPSGPNQLWNFVPQGDATYEIVNVNSNKCLSVYYDGRFAGAGLVQYDCHGWSDQLWEVSFPYGDGSTVKLKAVSSGMFADVPGDSNSWGTQIVQWNDRLVLPQQSFILTPLPQQVLDTSHVYRITTLASLALDVSGGSTADNVAVIQWPINGGTNQQWTFRLQPDGTYEVVNVNSGKCLSVYNNSLAGGGALVQYRCYGVANQHWNVRFDLTSGDKVIRLQSASSGMFVDVPGGTGDWGTQLIQWPDTQLQPNQYFGLTVLS